MEKEVLIDTWQKVTKDDYSKFGLFPQGSFDTIVGRLLIPDMAFSGFKTIQTGPAEVTVAEGRLFSKGKVFFNDTPGGTVVDMLARLPATTRRIVAITVWGVDQDSKLEPRTFLTNAETRAVVARETSTEHWRWANIGAVNGLESPNPQPPAVPTDVMTIAWVTLSNTGVVSVLMNTDGITPTLRDNQLRLDALDMWKISVGSQLDSLQDALLALAKRIYGLASFSLVRQIAEDVGELKEIAGLPDSYTSYGYDHFLTADESDLAHVDWLAKIDEGVRFPPAAGFDAQLGLLNPFDPLVINTNSVLLPKWTYLPVITGVGHNGEVSLAQYQYQTMNMVQKTMARKVTRYGTPFNASTSAAWWNKGKFDAAKQIFTRDDGATFQVLDAFAGSAADFSTNKFSMVRLQQVWETTVLEPYWDRIVTNNTLTGSVIAQTFVLSADLYISKLELFFSRIAATGNVEVLLTQLTNGEPDPSKVLARSTLTPAQLKVVSAADARYLGPPGTEFLFPPTFLQKDKYAFVVISVGNHYLWQTANQNSYGAASVAPPLLEPNPNAGGTMFYSTDMRWFQGDLLKDISFRLYCCKFSQSNSYVQLQPLQLQNGIAAIDINADTIEPQGTRLVYEVQVNGVWRALDNVDGGPSAVLNGLPPLLPFRAKFMGGSLTQPALGVDANSRVTTWRPRPDFKHISSIITLPAATTQLQIDIRVEAWDGAPHHSIAAKLLTGAGYLTVTLPTTTTIVTAKDDPAGAKIYRYAWTGMPAFSTFRLRLEGATDNVLNTFHVSERFHIVP